MHLLVSLIHFCINVIAELIVNECSSIPVYRHTWKRINASTAMWYQIPSSCSHIAILRLPKKDVAELCIYQLQCTCKCVCIPAWRFSRHARGYNNKAACANSKHDYHDDDKMNTLAFVNCLLVKIFSTLIRWNFSPSKFYAIRYQFFRKS